MTKKGSADNSWISFSDIMTGLMVIFLFVAVSYIVEVQKKQKERDSIFEEFRATKEKLFAELDESFHDDFRRWQVILDKDLSVKFTNPDVLFATAQTTIRPTFDTILQNFLPRYFAILLKDDYRNKIAEIRIEGHTDTVRAPQIDKDAYIGNLILSQLRSAEVMRYFQNLPYYKGLAEVDKQRLQFLLTANGLSYGRTLDDDKQLTAITHRPVNSEYSRRVEFRIVTTSETIVEQVLQEISNSQ